VDGEVLAVRVSGRLAGESERGQYRWAGHDARNVKIQDLTPNTRLNLFAALEVATGQIRTSKTVLKRREEFLEFMDQIVADSPTWFVRAANVWLGGWKSTVASRGTGASSSTGSCNRP
jgi:hypothetical protein